MNPPPYPRIPHLLPQSGGARDDVVLTPDEAAAFLSAPVLVEEKLDGANVALWLNQLGEPDASLRSGPGSMDRGGQLGRLRAWVAEHRLDVIRTLAGGWALYAEWLWRTHSVPYDRLPSYLVGLDLWHPESGFAPASERNERLERIGLSGPPIKYCGVVGDRARLDGLAREASSFGRHAAEGIVLRREGLAGSRIAKLLSPSFHRVNDETWETSTQHNRVKALPRFRV